MPTERLAPSAIFGSLTNLSGSVSAVQDDPDSPDANWLTAGDSTLGTEAQLVFPTASGSLTGIQQMKARVRKVGGANNPTVRLEARRLGVLITAGNEISVTSTSGQLVTLNWSGTDADQVRLAVVGTASGGSPSKRATVEVGAAEWNATYAVPTFDFTGSAAISGGGTVAATGRSARVASGSVSAGGSAQASGSSHRSGSVAISGGGLVAATGRDSTSADAVGSVAISGGGTAAAAGHKSSRGLVSVSGAGSVLSVGLRLSLGAAMVSGGGSVSSTGKSARRGSVVISGGGTVHAIARGQAAKKYCPPGVGAMIGVGR